MRPLSQTNPHIEDRAIRRCWLEENARDSCVFEGAQGLPQTTAQLSSRKRRLIASAKKLVKAAYSSK